MNIIAVIWIIFGALMFWTFAIILFWVAGRDIVIAFKRRFDPRGCDIFIANTNRNISHYYKRPKNNMFKIDKLPYVTNPEKTMNLREEDKIRFAAAMFKTTKRLKKRIGELEAKKIALDKLSKSMKNENQKLIISAEIERLDKVVGELKKKLKLRQESYFKDNRAAFFYIEGDPIPKDFYEYYSTLDSKMVDNLVSRAISESPQSKTEQDIRFMKMILYATIAASAVAAILAFRNQSILTELCKGLNIVCGA